MIDTSEAKTRLSLGDVRSAHALVSELLGQVRDGDIECMFDLDDKYETITNLLSDVLTRHNVTF